MLEKLRLVEERYLEMAERAGQPDFYADPKAASKLLREQKQLEPIVTAYRSFCKAKKEAEELRNPDFDGVDHISREDGCKVYFKDGSWVICRFSGTEPLLRMAAEAETKEKAEGYISTWKKFLSL